MVRLQQDEHNETVTVHPLSQVSDRGLEEAEGTQYDFNPLNLLAQYLMRNNPLHSSLPENNPYCSRLRQVLTIPSLRQVLTKLPDKTLMLH